ncbi:MAG: transglutaminase domain-containing protein [Myxococcota bacterium]
MANALYKILILFILNQVIHEPYPEDLKENSATIESEQMSRNFPNDTSDKSEKIEIKLPARYSSNSKNKNKVSKNLSWPDTTRLDSQTDKWDRNSFTPVVKYHPDITPNERIQVHKYFKLKTGTILTYSIPSEIYPLDIEKVDSAQRHSNYKFFWGQLQTGTFPAIIPFPSISPNMKLQGINYLDNSKNEEHSKIKLLRNYKGEFFLKFAKNSRKRRSLNIRISIAVPKSYYQLNTLDQRNGKTIKYHSLPTKNKFQKMRKLVKKHFGHFETEEKLVLTLVEYFRSFTIKPLKQNKKIPLYKSILLQKKGVCRHRSQIFFAMVKSFNIPVNFVFNENHAFCEVYLQDAWRLADLGGAPVNSSDKPPNKENNQEPSPKSKPQKPDNKNNNLKAQKYIRKIESSNYQPHRGTSLKIKINFKEIPLLSHGLLNLVDKNEEVLSSEIFFPILLKNRSQELSFKIPDNVLPGKYKLRITFPEESKTE